MLIRLQADLKTAMLARDAARTQVLRMALAAYKNEAVAKGLGPQGTLPETEAIAVFKRVELGLGAGHSFTEYAAMGLPFDPAKVRKARIPPPSGRRPKIPIALERLVMKALQAAHGGAIDGKAASALVQSLLA